MHNTGIRYSSKERMPTVLSEMAELLPPFERGAAGCAGSRPLGKWLLCPSHRQ